jgi:hypothetical protein
VTQAGSCSAAIADSIGKSTAAIALTMKDLWNRDYTSHWRTPAC